MKKNAMLKIAAILMVAVLLTTCAISSTFAKYSVTVPASTAQARVAKWGVSASLDITQLFLPGYDEANEYDAEAADKSAYTVLAANNAAEVADNLIAPGTKRSLDLTSAISGTPEVAVNVSANVTVEMTGDWKYDNAAYCPVVFFVNGKVYGFAGMKYTDTQGQVKTVAAGDDNVVVCTSVSDLSGQVAAAIKLALTGDKNGTKEYPANSNLGTIVNSFNLGWEWVFENGNDLADNALGSTAANKVPSISISASLTIDQID